MRAELAELMRQMAQRVLENHRMGRVVDPQALADAARTLQTTPPLGRAIGPGRHDERRA